METLADQVRTGDRRALARAITLVESTRPDHREEADAVLEAALPSTGGAVRVGLSGSPGVGKSTFIEALGQHVTEAGQSVAVLAVDPSSARSGGSILGDKTRMTELARNPDAFIRPSPAGTTTGGVARRTREALLLCEAAGFDVVVVETVGVGQSDTAVADMVDVFVVLVGPGGGDDLQGIKRGLMELADIVSVTKADGALLGAAQQTAADYRMALHLMRPKHGVWEPVVILSSALDGSGIAEVWTAVLECRDALEASGDLGRLRSAQAVAWMWSEVRERLLHALRDDPAVTATLAEMEQKVARGEVTPAAAAAAIVGNHRAT